jgi:hypothetical protein
LRKEGDLAGFVVARNAAGQAELRVPSPLGSAHIAFRGHLAGAGRVQARIVLIGVGERLIQRFGPCCQNDRCRKQQPG